MDHDELEVLPLDAVEPIAIPEHESLAVGRLLLAAEEWALIDPVNHAIGGDISASPGGESSPT